VRIVVTAHDFEIGGTQTYALTVTEQLQRLGHDVTIHAAELGPAVEIARDRGLQLAETESDLPDEADVVLAQDSMMSYRMADRYPTAPQLFRCPTELFDLQLPPQLPGIVSALMVLSDRFADRLRALAVTQEIVRMRQPIDTERFAARGAIRERPRKAILLGTYLHGERLTMLVDAWRAEGIECVPMSSTLAPEAAMGDADIVVAKGKAAIEGMACSRAVYVYDQFGCDGWVTPDSYPAIEADNFAGQATDFSPTPASLRAAVAEYDPAMGIANRDIAVRHHGARKHAQELAQLMAGLAPRAPQPDVPLRELARLVRVQWATESRSHRQAMENTFLHQRLLDVEQAWSDAEKRYSTLTRTRRYRLASAMGRVVDRVRGAA
jgi:hypothetical protein